MLDLLALALGNDLDNQYERACTDLADLGPVVERLIREVLKAEGLRTHSTAHRIKSKPSVRRKLAKEVGYDEPADLHDLLGVRIITFFPDEVDQVARVMEREFAIDWDNSVDKREILDPDRFGYLSLHYVATLSEARAGLTEHKRFAGKVFEIQIRSILQHAWAEIEHDLGYHVPGAVPRSIRRRFSRLAGLLEVADDEFQRLRDDALAHQQAVDREIASAPESLALDRDSLAALIRTNDSIQALDDYLAKVLGMEISSPDDQFAGEIADELQSIGLTTIAEVLRALEERTKVIKRFADGWSELMGPGGELTPGLSLFYLAYVFVAESGSYDDVLRYLEANNIGGAAAPEVAKDVLRTYARAAE